MKAIEKKARNDKLIAQLKPIADELGKIRKAAVTLKTEAAAIGNDGWRELNQTEVLDPRKYSKEEHLVHCRLHSAVSYLQTDSLRTAQREKQAEVEAAKRKAAEMEAAASAV